MDVELKEVNVTPDQPLLNEKFPDEVNSVSCSYTQNGTTHTTNLRVVVQGDRTRSHSMVTFHDVGLNSVSNFGPLMNSEEMQRVSQYYCIYHINAPGQEEDTVPLPSGFVYPSMENLSEMINSVFSHFGIKNAVCLGVGAGANVLIRFALKNPSMVEGLILVNPTVTSVGNLSWIGEKISNFATPFNEQILNYHFSKAELDQANHELLETHRKHFQQHMNENNVQLFFNEFERRNEVSIARSIDPHLSDKTTLSCQTFILVGDLSPFVDDAVEVNSRLNPKKTTLLKMADAGGMILEEQIFKVAESFVYFLQGLGHIPGAMMMRLARSRSISVGSTGSGEGGDGRRVRTFSGGSLGSPTNVVPEQMLPSKENDKAQLLSSPVC